ncbi:hypothetical protein ASD98_05145 [Flavobacterium sp. Root186]|nr:hypothetical protein ASD98_05145 [Flavobacterium sp. Root186]
MTNLSRKYGFCYKFVFEPLLFILKSKIFAVHLEFVISKINYKSENKINQKKILNKDFNSKSKSKIRNLK